MAAYTARVTLLARDLAAWDEPWPMLLAEDQQSRVATINDTARPVSSQTLHGLFAAQAVIQPDQPAVITKARTLTYGELDAMARRLGRRLRELGAKPNTPVAIVMDKGWEQVAAVLGVLYSGAAYVPVDAGLPAARRQLLLERSGASLALIQPWVKFEGLAEVQCLVVEGDLPTGYEAPALEFVQTPTDLAYLIYTSGSTGEPKGVMLNHRGPVNTVLDINARFAVTPTDRVFGLSSLSFDLSVYDIFGPLAVGGAIVLPSSKDRSDAQNWPAHLEGVTIWNTVPALMQMLVEHAEGRPDVIASLQRLQLVLLSGDWIPVSLPGAIRALAPQAQVIGLGGATEGSIWSILHPVVEAPSTWSSIPYGRPMANQRFYVLTASLELCPTWLPGELYIGGLGLAQGYWRDEKQTQERFIVHPRTGERLYRTGDWGRWLPGGDIEFLGRRDQQVKVHGYRVELGEIEAVLERHAEVQQAVVVAVGEREKRLVAHVVLGASEEDFFAERLLVPSHQKVTDAAVLRAFCEKALPAYMVPVQIQIRESLPLNVNGKVDRAALSKHVWSEPARVGAPPPGGRSIAKLTEIVSRVAAETLEVQEVPVETLFADLGLDSLLALRFRDRLQRVLDHSLPATFVYDYPSVAAIVRALAPAEVPHPTVRIDATEPIAIVGMSCRAPGGIVDAEGYWALEEGRDAIGPFPERWDTDALFDPDPEAIGKSYAPEGRFLPRVGAPPLGGRSIAKLTEIVSRVAAENS